jgi:cytoskeleton protein RodZ
LERHEDTAASPGNDAQDPGLETRESVSETLLRAREDYGQDLRSVSDSLRIRYIYLLAIEEGRFDDLPGATYAVGFVRTYADYLGLDSEEIVRRFKAEVEGLERRTQLVFPVPKPEGKLPGGAIIMISLLLVGIAYGGWYFLSQSDQSFVELFSGEETAPEGEIASSDAPAQQDEPEAAETAPDPTQGDAVDQATISQDTASEEAMSEDGAADTTATAGTAQLQAGEGGGDVETLPPDPPVETEVLPAPGEGEQTQAAQPSADDGAAGSMSPEAAAGDTRQEVPEAAAAEPTEPDDAAAPANETEAADDATEATTATGTTTEPADGQDGAAAIPAAPRSDQVASAPAGRVFGESEQPVRIVVRAKQDAWVQVRDAQNQLLLTEVLRSGDVYRVPDLDGLTMLTGNAGGLEITVDGQVAPTLGPIGVVRRNVALDPQRLSSGNAVGQQNVE